MITALLAAHASMLAQTGFLVAACLKGWGSRVDSLPEEAALRAVRRPLDRLYHGFSRMSVCALLQKANKQTNYSKYTKVLLGAVPVWVLGSMVGLAVNRLPVETFWSPLGRDCDYLVWACIVGTGAVTDVIIGGLSISLIAGLQMQMVKRAYSIAVFAIGVLANVLLIYGVIYLRQHSSQISSDPTLNSAPFIVANQVAIAVTLWCRALEAARHLQRDIGHATWGHRYDPTDRYYAGYTSAHKYHITTTPHRTMLASKSRHAREDDEIELQAQDPTARYTASIRATDTDDGHSHNQEIAVTKQLWVT